MRLGGPASATHMLLLLLSWTSLTSSSDDHEPDVAKSLIFDFGQLKKITMCAFRDDLAINIALIDLKSSL